MNRTLCLSLSLCTLAITSGCDSGSSQSAPADAASAALDANPDVTQAIQSGLSVAMNDCGKRYTPLKYKFNEDLLVMLDQIEAHLSGKSEDPAPDFIPTLDEKEEFEHYRESIRRWEDQTKKSLRATVDPLKADVAARKPGATFHPEFQQKFADELGALVKIEIEEMRERRNRALHTAADTLFAPYRDKNPEIVDHFEATLNSPQYALPSPSEPQPAPAPSS